jgi:uncharacterized Zn-finger protein
MNTKQIIVDEIKRLSQEEGLKDNEIAEIIGYHKVSVARIRKEYGIPKCIMSNRKDKEVVCPLCHKKYFIRRNEKYGIGCNDCLIKLEEKTKELALKELEREKQGLEEY